MTKQLHNLIDSGATQPVINERVAGLLEKQQTDLERIEKAIDKITSDHEARIRRNERMLYIGAGAIFLISAIPNLVTMIEHFIK